MATMRGNTLSSVLVLAGALAGGVMASGCGENPVPLNPTYSQHIKPIMTAYCIRCHGAGGMPNGDPEIPVGFNPVSPPPLKIPTMIGIKNKPSPAADLTTYEGIAKYAYSGGAPNAFMEAFLPYMPPPPSSPISGWELDTLQAWLKNPLP
jgi:hypothetical protein